MEELNLKEISSYIASKISFIIICTIIFGLLGAGYVNFIQTPKYSSSTTVLLTKVAEKETSELTQNDVMLNQKLVPIFREIIKSERILGIVVNELDLFYTTKELSNMITISSVKETEIMKIMVSNTDAVVASEISNKLAEVFQEEIVKIYNKSIGVGIIDDAQVAKNPYNINKPLHVAFVTLIGLFISITILLVTYYFDTTIKSVEQVEKVIELPVIGSVPKKSKKGGK